MPNQSELQREDQAGPEIEPEQIARLAERLSAIGHDLNNMLGTMLGYGVLVLDDLPRDDPNHAFMAKVVEAGVEAKQLIDDLLEQSRSVRERSGARLPKAA